MGKGGRKGGKGVRGKGQEGGRAFSPSLNRWNSASSQASSLPDCWGQSVPSGGYDRYGNLLTINVSKCSAPSLSIGVNGSNQVSGWSYDAAGDVTNDTAYTYTWDAEARVASAEERGRKGGQEPFSPLSEISERGF